MNIRQTILITAIALLTATHGDAQGLYRSRSSQPRFGNYGPYITRPLYGSNLIQRHSRFRYSPYFVTQPFNVRRPPSELYGSYNYRATPPITSGNYIYTPPISSYRPTYRANDQGTAGSTLPPPTTGKATTKIQVRLPVADAKLWFEGVLTKQTGTVRNFVTPTLEVGQEYEYTIRAVWQENNKTRERSRNVRIRAGQERLLDVTKR